MTNAESNIEANQENNSKIHLQLISSFIGMNFFLFVCLFVFIMKRN